MGMYTSLEFTATIKPKYYPVINRLEHWRSEEADAKEPWDNTAREFPDLPFLRAWADHDRANFIPFGGSSHLHSKHSFKDGVWAVECSLKNYKDNIEFFLTTVLAEVASDLIECESNYEENQWNTTWILKDGTITAVPRDWRELPGDNYWGKWL